MKKPEFVTFTGIDAKTDLRRCEALSERYPIEWGILFSKSRQGVESRYPETDVIAAAMVAKIQRAAHLCGSYARFANGGNLLPESTIADFRAGFARVQINVPDPMPALITMAMRSSAGVRAICQTRGDTLFPFDESVDWLYDRSGGQGSLPERWPMHPRDKRRLVGFAGGIGPHNVLAAVSAIDSTGRYWIDMETHIRTDDWLDLDKCEAICRALWSTRAFGYGTSGPRVRR
jgi:hypothetical protein